MKEKCTSDGCVFFCLGAEAGFELNQKRTPNGTAGQS